jgi:hypothetical protein
MLLGAIFDVEKPQEGQRSVRCADLPFGQTLRALSGDGLLRWVVAAAFGPRLVNLERDIERRPGKVGLEAKVKRP